MKLLRLMPLALPLVVALAARAEPVPPLPPLPPVPPAPPVAVDDDDADEARRDADEARRDAEEEKREAEREKRDAEREAKDAEREAEADKREAEREAERERREAEREGKDGGAVAKGVNLDVNIANNGDNNDVAILVPLGFFLMVALVYAMAQLSRFKREARLHETLRLAMERGLEVDVTAVLPPPRNDRRRGILLCFVGAGVFLFFLCVDGFDSAGMGFVPGMIGLGYLISDRLERRV